MSIRFSLEGPNRGRALLFIVGRKIASDQRLGAEYIEEIPGNHAGFHLFGFGAAQQDELHVVVFDDGVQAAILASIVEHFGYRNIGASRSLAGQALAKQ